jgi:hypothetical protein
MAFAKSQLGAGTERAVGAPCSSPSRSRQGAHPAGGRSWRTLGFNIIATGGTQRYL